MSWTAVRNSASVDPQVSPLDCYEGYTRSVDVLATDGRRWCVAYLVTNDWGRRWKQAGRDSYDYDGVKEWMELPPVKMDGGSVS